MRGSTVVSILTAVVGLAVIPEASATPLTIDPAALAPYFSPAEIAAYMQAYANAQKAASSSADEPIRMASDGWNRCVDGPAVPVADCKAMQDSAYNNKCINASEYDYCRNVGIAPICSPITKTLYLGWCRCGCFEKETNILAYNAAADQSTMVKVTSIAKGDKIYAMTETATLDTPELAPRSVIATTEGPEAKPLVWVHLENGTVLGLSEQHAVLLSTGEMIPAVQLDAVSHQLVSRYGEFVGIKSIERAMTDDHVYNVLTDAKMSHLGHMVVANDMIVGDIMWQNTLSGDLYKIVVRM